MRGMGMTVLVMALVCLWSPRADATSYVSYWKSPRPTDYVLDHKFYSYLERVTKVPFTELRKAQLTLTSYRETSKYSVKGDANDAARIFFSLKPRSVTFSTARYGNCGLQGCKSRRNRRRNRYRYIRTYYLTNKRTRRLLTGSRLTKDKSRKSKETRRVDRKSNRRSPKGKIMRGSEKEKSQRGSKRISGRKGSKGRVLGSRGYRGGRRRSGRRRGSRRRGYGRRYRRRRRTSLTARGRVGMYDVVLMTNRRKAQIVFVPRRSVYSYNRELRIKRIFTFRANTFWERILY